VEITIKELEPEPIVIIRVRSRVGHVGEAFGDVIPELFAALDAVGSRPAGPVVARYSNAAGDSFDVEIGVPVSSPVEPTGRVEMAALPGGPAATTIHVGAPDGLRTAFDEFHHTVDAQGHSHRGDPWERYLTNPDEEPDMSKWQTELVIPIG
jgi:effector-binding domain-containing protein